MTTFEQRIHGCLVGVAAGDAMGMPTSLMSPSSIEETFGRPVEDFLPAPEGHVIHDGMVAGQITDDTQQTLLLADSLIAKGRVDSRDIADRLLKWAEGMGAFDSMMVGPSSLRALYAIRSGAPIEKSGVTGDTNGATMRIAPIGIYGNGDLEKTVDAVADACMPTHYTNIAIAGASAVATIIGCGIQGTSDLDELLGYAMQAVDLGMTKGTNWFGASIKSRTALALDIAGRSNDRDVVLADLYQTIGAGVATTETVPVCLGMLKFADGRPIEAIRMATNLGGDCDTTASIVGGMCGAIAGVGAFPGEWIETLEEINDLRLAEYAGKLAEVTRLGD
ncbi:MAG: ADP-ribosylglycohydrolase family protein [Thermoanaerobaculia bacterium]